MYTYIQRQQSAHIWLIKTDWNSCIFHTHVMDLERKITVCLTGSPHQCKHATDKFSAIHTHKNVRESNFTSTYIECPEIIFWCTTIILKRDRTTCMMLEKGNQAATGGRDMNIQTYMQNKLKMGVVAHSHHLEKLARLALRYIIVAVAAVIGVYTHIMYEMYCSIGCLVFVSSQQACHNDCAFLNTQYYLHLPSLHRVAHAKVFNI